MGYANRPRCTKVSGRPLSISCVWNAILLNLLADWVLHGEQKKFDEQRWVRQISKPAMKHYRG